MFFDGSALISQIRELQREKAEFQGKRLDPVEMVGVYMSYRLQELHGGAFRRAVFYFPNGDSHIQTYLILPDQKIPGKIRDIHFKYCGQKIKGSKAYDEWLASVPAQFKDRCRKSEKGIDIEICCDALKLAASGRMDRLFLLTNDSDFLPLFRTLKDFGVNVSLFHLSKTNKANENLLQECDTYDVVDDAELQRIFIGGGIKLSSLREKLEKAQAPLGDA